MKKQKKKYSRPQRPFDKVRIDEENILRDKYGLKNKKEIWKADAAIGRIRNIGKQLITASEEEKQAFVKRLQKKGFEIDNIASALALNKEDWLKRRLQTVLLMKKLANTAKQARQLITHKHVSVGGRIVNIPSYQVDLEEGPLVRLNISLKVIEIPKSKEQEIKEEILEESEKLQEKLEDVEKKGEKIEKEIVEKIIDKVEEDKKTIESAEKEIADKIAKEEVKINKIKEDVDEKLEELKDKN